MHWLLSNIPTLVFLAVAFSVVRAIVRAAQLSQEHKATTSETDEQRRVREIQERIRRKIAERRGGGGAAGSLAPTPTAAAMPPAGANAEANRPSAPMRRTTNVPPLEPFGGPSRRLVIESMRRAVTPAPAAEPPPIDAAAIERQQKLNEQIRALDDARVATERRAAQIVTQRENAATSSSAAPAAVWLGDLRDPRTLRRAFVLREVLGAPVALK